eukprot:3855909-Lingulodinium_polyedra.AAC.1
MRDRVAHLRHQAPGPPGVVGEAGGGRFYWQGRGSHRVFVGGADIGQRRRGAMDFDNRRDVEEVGGHGLVHGASDRADG